MAEPERSPDKGRLESELERTLRPLSRRRFLIGGLALSVAGAVGVRSCLQLEAGPIPAGITTLTPGECAFFTRLIDVFLPVAGTPLYPPSKLPMLKNLDEAFAALDPKVRDDLGMGIKLFRFGPLVIGFHFSSFERLSDADARAYCDRWMRGNDTQVAIFSAMRQFVFASYWREEATWAGVNYDGPVTERLHHPRLGNAPSPTA